MNRYDSLTSLIWFLAGIGIVLWSSMTLRVGTLPNPGSGFLPLLCGIFMCCMAVIVFFQAPKKEKKLMEKNLFIDQSLINISVLVIILLAYAFFLEHLGFNLSTFIVLFFIFTIVAKTRWFIGLVESLIATAVCYWVFGYLLEIRLPKGWLRF